MTYHLAPWDEPIFGGNTAVIASIHVRIETEAATAFEVFQEWCLQNRTKLVSCRLPQEQLVECGFLEKQGFRFIELNYRPILTGLDGFSEDAEIAVSPALPKTQKKSPASRRRSSRPGGFMLTRWSGRRLAIVATAFGQQTPSIIPDQRVLKCQMGGRIVAFMVVEQPTPASRFWSLVGLAPVWLERASDDAYGRQCLPSITARA